MKKGKRDENISETQKPIYKKWWFWLIIAIVVFAGIGGNSNSKTETKKETKKFLLYRYPLFHIMNA